MATKAKTLQVKDKEKDDKAADAPEKDSTDAPSPLLDLSDAAVKKMIKQAKKRGFVTFDQLNEVLPSDTTSPEQIEDIMSMLSDMGINVSEAEDADSEEETRKRPRTRPTTSSSRSRRRPSPKSRSPSPASAPTIPCACICARWARSSCSPREGEIAIAKRIEAGREAMIAGLCESPLTFQAIIIWRDELNEGKIFLRDIIDLEATYAGPDAKGNMNTGADRSRSALTASRSAANGNGGWRCGGCRSRPRRCRAARRAAFADPVPRRAGRRSRRGRGKGSAPKPPPKATWMTTSSKTRCRSPPSRPS